MNGPISLQDIAGVVRINSDSGSLTLLGNISEANKVRARENKILTFGGNGNVIVSGQISGKASVSLAKDGTGTLELTGNNSYQGTTVINGGTVIIRGANGDIQSSSSITINNATLSLDNTLANKNDRIGNVPLTMNSGTFNYIHAPLSGTNYTETIGGVLTLGSGVSTIRTDASAPGNHSILTFGSLSRSAGATVNFGGGTSNPSAANDDNNIRITGQAAGFIGVWATVGGNRFAFYNTASATDSVEALSTFEQTVTRLDSGAKSISSNNTDNVQITDGTGAEGNIALAASSR